MKIGLISDLHSNLAAIKAVLEDMPRVDKIICVGDLVGYGAEPNEVVDLVRSKCIQAVMGDHDHAALTCDVRGFNSSAAKAALWTAEKLSGENLKFLSNLPTHLRLDIKQRVYVVHGSPRDPLKGFISRDQPNRELAGIIEGVGADVVVFGHTHVPMKRMVMGKLIVNPGSVGQPRDRDPRASYAVLTIGKDVEVSHSRVDYDIEGTAAKMRAAGLPEELAARLFFGW
jgi:putative phosphoesterase